MRKFLFLSSYLFFSLSIQVQSMEKDSIGESLLVLEDSHVRFYQKGGFVLCEPVYFLDERSRSGPEVQKETHTTIRNGMIYDYQNKLLDTGDKEYIYVMNYDGTIYTGSSGMHHSYFLKSKPDKSGYGIGKNVACAGHIKIHEGKVIFIDNASGHYHPNIDQLKIAAISLFKSGVLDPDAVIQSLGHESTGGRIKILSLQEIMNEDVQKILSQYSPVVKRTQNYIEGRRAASNKFDENVRQFNSQCPVLKDSLGNLLPDFYFPSSQGRFDYGIKELENKKWRVLLDNYNQNLPESVKNYPSKNISFGYPDSTEIVEQKEMGLEIKRVACQYVFGSLPPGNYRSFKLYLVPLIPGIATDFVASNPKDSNADIPDTRDADTLVTMLKMKREISKLDPHYDFSNANSMQVQSYLTRLKLKHEISKFDPNYAFDVNDQHADVMGAEFYLKRLKLKEEISTLDPHYAFDAKDPNSDTMYAQFYLMKLKLKHEISKFDPNYAFDVNDQHADVMGAELYLRKLKQGFRG